MAIRIPPTAARAELEEAYKVALNDVRLPEKWLDIATSLRKNRGPRTYVPALGTALLARACNDTVDALSIKANYANNSYSARTLCHGVLVPSSVEHGFDLYATGREPLNNQPFFRYDHYTTVERIASDSRPFWDILFGAVSELNSYSRYEARLALAAFLRVALEAARVKQKRIGGSAIVESSLVALCREFVTTGFDIPRKLQACVAAGLDLCHADVRSRRLNDPSRDVPGDVHVYVEQMAVLAVEVRGKPVKSHELRQFVHRVADARIGRAALVVDCADHSRLPLDSLVPELERESGELVMVAEGLDDFLRWSFGWSGKTVSHVLSIFPELVYNRMVEIEVDDAELERWTTVFPEDSADNEV